MSVRINKGNEMMQMPVIPLVDTLFNLFVFFLVTTTVAEAEREVPVNPPVASEAQAIISKPREMIVNVDEKGHYIIVDKTLTLPQLEQVLKQAWVNNPGRASVVIRADKRCRWEFVSDVINACKKAKIHDIRFTARAPQEKAG
jgi:biopolymer transport protein ExbD